MIDDPDALLAASAAIRAEFEACLTADTRVAMLLALLGGERNHTLTERAELWRGFGPRQAASAEGTAAARNE